MSAYTSSSATGHGLGRPTDFFDMQAGPLDEDDLRETDSSEIVNTAAMLAWFQRHTKMDLEALVECTHPDFGAQANAMHDEFAPWFKLTDEEKEVRFSPPASRRPACATASEERRDGIPH
jgi:hypothetical protein